MAAPDINIICEKWSWFGGTSDFANVNFFHPPIVVNQYTSYPRNSETIDLTEFVLKKNDLVFSAQKEDINEKESSTALYRIFDSLQLSLSNLKDSRITDFFKFFDTNYRLNVAPFIKYKIFVKYKGTLIFQGVLNSNDIAYFFPEDIDERDVVDLTVYSWDREFKDYFSAKEMPSINYWSPWTNPNVSNVLLVELLYYSYNIRDASGAGIFLLDSGIQNKPIGKWRIVQTPELRFNSSNVNKFFLNGYDFCKDIARFNMYDYLKLMCNSFGWLFYWDIIDGELRFVIRNRVAKENFYRPREINFNNVMSWQISLEQFSKPTEIVKMSVIELLGGSEVFRPGGPNELGGARDLFWISPNINLPPPSNNFTPWSSLSQASDAISMGTTSGYKHSRYADSNNNNKLHYIDYVNYNIGSYGISKHKYYDIDKILDVRAGDNNFRFSKKRRIDFHNSVHSYFEEGIFRSESDLIFCGNIGTGMFYADNTGEMWPYFTPGEDNVNYVYYRSPQFNKNMQALLTANSSLILEVKVKGFYPYGNETISFSNFANPLFGYKYDIISLQADAKEETTTYKLRQRI